MLLKSIFDNSIVSNMESINVLKKLGNGVFGTVYLVKINGKKYIAKIEKIVEKEIKYNTSYNLWREIDFSKFAADYPNYFMTLKSWTIANNCKHEQPAPKNHNIDAKIKKQLDDKNNSTNCSILIYDPILDDTLETFYKKLQRAPTIKNYNVFYSMFCQMLNIFDLLIKNKYLHTDAHAGNIMYKKTTQKTIKIGTTNVPTFGFNWFLIDYGGILHPKFNVTSTEKQQLKQKFSDIVSFIYTSIQMPIWKIVDKEKLQTETWKNMVIKIKASSEYKSIKQYLPNVKNNKTLLSHCTLLVYLVHYPTQYHAVMNIDVKKYKK